MKKIIFIAMLLAIFSTSFADSHVLPVKGNIIETSYTFKDKNDVVYPIFLQDGRAFILKRKDGKIIKKWLGSNVAETIIKNMEQ